MISIKGLAFSKSQTQSWLRDWNFQILEVSILIVKTESRSSLVLTKANPWPNKILVKLCHSVVAKWKQKKMIKPWTSETHYAKMLKVKSQLNKRQMISKLFKASGCASKVCSGWGHGHLRGLLQGTEWRSSWKHRWFRK